METRFRRAEIPDSRRENIDLVLLNLRSLLLERRGLKATCPCLLGPGSLRGMDTPGTFHMEQRVREEEAWEGGARNRAFLPGSSQTPSGSWFCPSPSSTLGVGTCVSRETFLLLLILPPGRRGGEPGEGQGPGFGGAAWETLQASWEPCREHSLLGIADT